jgi:hypothetical protein
MFAVVAGSQSVLAFDKESQCAVLRAHCDYRAGEEVFDSYGAPSIRQERVIAIVR